MTKPFLMPQPESRAGVRKPGMMVLPKGVERHPVPGGGQPRRTNFCGRSDYAARCGRFATH